MTGGSATSTEIEHDGCPYVAVLVKDGYWICTKCGRGGEVPAE